MLQMCSTGKRFFRLFLHVTHPIPCEQAHLSLPLQLRLLPCSIPSISPLSPTTLLPLPPCAPRTTPALCQSCPHRISSALLELTARAPLLEPLTFRELCKASPVSNDASGYKRRGWGAQACAFTWCRDDPAFLYHSVHLSVPRKQVPGGVRAGSSP